MTNKIKETIKLLEDLIDRIWLETAPTIDIQKLQALKEFWEAELLKQ